MHSVLCNKALVCNKGLYLANDSPCNPESCVRNFSMGGVSRGARAQTRYCFSRGFKNHGVLPTTVYLTNYRVGDVVDIVGNGAIQKGLPYKYYHGKTGVVFNVTKSALGVIVYKIVRNRYVEKRLSVRIEHVRHSKCRLDFIKRVQETAAKKIEAREKGERVQLKRQPAQPRPGHVLSLAAKPETIAPVPYETYI